VFALAQFSFPPHSRSHYTFILLRLRFAFSAIGFD
jgi:hypothetical protein